jgi:hypothetical protein
MMVMDKWTKFDWSLSLPDNDFFKEITGNPFIVEGDVFGEYFGKGKLPIMFREHIVHKFEYCNTFPHHGFVLRVDRDYSHPFDSVNESNLIVTYAMLNGKNVDEELDKFFTELLLQESDDAKCIRLYGLEDCLFVLSIEDKDFQQEAMAALRICHRHNYKITDRELWRDMIEQLYKMEKDLHNPHYVCPANLKEAHDKVSATYRKNLQKIQEKQQIRQAAAQLEEFLQHMQAFMDLCFTNDHITIRPLRSPLEYIEEGKAMHHCVASYKDRYNSLILSARDADEKRLATIEVDLTSYRIVQIRGLQNAATPHHEEIAILLTKNMQYIRKANQQQKKLNAAQSA